MKAIILLILAAGVSRAASLSALTLTVPPAFEENRGQSPTAFRYVLGHLTMGFGCDGVYGGRTPLRPPSEIRFVDARTSCSAEASESDGTFTRFYRGGESIGPLPRYRVLRFRDVWPGVSLEYRANESSLTARFELRTAADLRVIRLSAQSILPGSNTISTNLGVWRISASQGNEVAVSARLDSLGVHFLAPAANPSLPMTLTMEVPVTIPTWSTRVFAAPQAIADAAGNWYFAGTTTVYSEADENSSICIEGGLTNHCPDAFVAMFDSKGAFRYAVYLLGSRYEQTGSIRTDLDGNIYVAGWTYSRDFPTTVGAIQTQYQGPDEMRPVSRVYRGGDGFVAKIHGPTGGLIYSTLIGGKGEDTIQSLAVDALGQTYLSMNSNMADLPLAGDAVTSTPHCCGRLMSISEDGSRIRYSLAENSDQVRVSTSGSMYVRRRVGGGVSPLEELLALHPDGTLRYRRSVQFPAVTEMTRIALGGDETLWLGAVVREAETQRRLGWQLALVDASGDVKRVGDYVAPAGMDLESDGAGGLWITGYSLVDFAPTPDAPLQQGCNGCGGVLRVDRSGAVRFATYVPFVPEPPGASGDRLFLAPRSSATVYTVDLRAAARPVLSHVSDPSGLSPAAFPGTVFSLNGTAIGPSTSVEWPRGADGRAAQQVEGVRVLIDQEPARILAASSSRITVMVPLNRSRYESGTARLQHNGETVASIALTPGYDPFVLLAGPDAPLGFAIQNEDGSENSLNNPARPGSTIQFYVVAVGETDPPLEEGSYVHSVPARPRAKVEVQFDLRGLPGEIVAFAQSARHVAGIFEMRVRLPSEIPANATALPVLFREGVRQIFPSRLAAVFVSAR